MGQQSLLQVEDLSQCGHIQVWREMKKSPIESAVALQD